MRYTNRFCRESFLQLSQANLENLLPRKFRGGSLSVSVYKNEKMNFPGQRTDRVASL